MGEFGELFPVIGIKPDHARLAWDLSYACAMCRVHYLRCQQALPPAGDIEAQAAYWKEHFNTPQGAGMATQYVANWNRVMGQTS